MRAGLPDRRALLRGAAGRAVRRPGVIPSPVLAALRRNLRPDASDPIESRLVGGGCINNGARVETRTGRFFLKWNADAGHRFFRVEAEGLEALSATKSVRTPNVVARSGGDDPVPWLLLEWIAPGRANYASWARLGRELAALHRGGTDDAGRWGWHSDNVIGSLPQPNGWADDWGDFWARRRTHPIARELLTRGAISPRQLGLITRAADRADRLLGPASRADGPSLLHGDLWSGNVLFARGGRPVLIDPAVYIGHREVDLAMCRLFGGFPPRFYDAYTEAWPLGEGHEHRLALYQLYPLLVHARLFGGGYIVSALRAAESAANC
ncbi:MAG: fructosamine kinase family protein [Gemmatimonadetes bacterium]|nr:fructosamine kinase family protein [Gemmatimonadota bacterium]MYD12244.1 fructosamine kinase family protein [Gemmatimonadota bacterium]MYI65503.1 fructosamine kinase family protein [Gemmatimonadota bacterium]